MTPTALRQTEAELQQAIIDLAIALGWLVYHTHDSRHSASGFPDLTLVRGDRLLFAELKSETGKLSLSQQVWFEALVASGNDVRVWRPSDWPGIERELRRR
jgi:hypothetical protein